MGTRGVFRLSELSSNPQPQVPQSRNINQNEDLTEIRTMATAFFNAVDKILGELTNLRFQYERLEMRCKHIEERLDTQNGQHVSPLVPRDLTSQTGWPTSFSSTPAPAPAPASASALASSFGLFLVEPPSARPNVRPDNHPVAVLWTLHDAWEDPLAEILAPNKYRPNMRKCVRNKDGTLLTDEQWRSIRASTSTVYREYLEPAANRNLASSCDKSAPTKTFYVNHHKDEWNKAVAELERREPLLCLCAQNWKAEHVLSRKLETAARKMRGKNTGKSKVCADVGDDEGVREDEEDGAEDEEDELPVDVTTKTSKCRADPIEISSERAFKKKKTTHTPSDQSINQQHVESQQPSASLDSPSPIPGDILVDASYIKVDPTYKALHHTFSVYPFNSITHSLDLLEALESLPNSDIEPSPALQEFLNTIETADPYASDLDEDDTNASWGHHHFRSGTLGFNNLSWPATWADIGTREIAYRVLAATIRTCLVSRILCFKRHTGASTFLADVYLSKIVERLWEQVQLHQKKIASAYSQTVVALPSRRSSRATSAGLRVNERWPDQARSIKMNIIRSTLSKK